MNAPNDRVIGTAGHIDHGKTALVRALTGVNTDRLPAEKARGITIDLGFASLRLGSQQLAIIDVPGHERFIRNMLAGATGLDLALLVVAADDSVMPQTREHLEILRMLGLAGGVIALTKCDLADPAWLDMVEDDVRKLIRGTFLEDCAIVRTSSATGFGIDALRDALFHVSTHSPPRTDPGPFRMAIDRVFTRAGHGTIVTGTVASGAVRVGEELECWPDGKVVRVRGLHRHDRAVETVGRGTRAAINLVGVHHTEVIRGHELATPGYLATTQTLSVHVSASIDAPRPMKHRSQYRLHLGTAEVSATLSLLCGNSVAPGESSLAQLFLARPIVATHGQPFVIREASPAATLGGGHVLQPVASKIRRNDHVALARLLRLRSENPRDRLEAVLGFAGLDPPERLPLSRDTSIPAADLPEIFEDLRRLEKFVGLAVAPRKLVWISWEQLQTLEARVIRALERLHHARPRQTVLRKPMLLAELPDLKGDSLVFALLERLKIAGKIVSDDRTVALTEFKPRLSQSERKLKAQLALSIEAAGLSPPHLDELCDDHRAKTSVIRELLALLVDEGRIVEIGHGFHLHVAAETAMREAIASHWNETESVTMSEIRDLLNTTRKFAVPFGEYLDQIGWTRREGDLRFPGPKSASHSGVVRAPARGGQ